MIIIQAVKIVNFFEIKLNKNDIKDKNVNKN